MTALNDEVRVIEAGNVPARFARGWHCLGLADSFKDGKPHEIEAFGTKLVVFRGEDDEQLHVLNAYCPHMGGNLAHGTVKGDAVACPFHDWRWSGDGRCAGIPYARRVPPRARTRAWTTLERNRQLFVWHDPAGDPPPAEVTIPEIEGVHGPDAGEWSDWTWKTARVDGSNCREIVDNVVDMAHFFYVHYAFPTYFKNIFDGHIATQYMESAPRGDMDLGNLSSPLRSDASYYGPSYMIDYVWTEVAPGVEMEMVLINSHYPISANSFVLQYGAIVKKLPGMTDEAAAEAARSLIGGLETGFEQDIEIWRNKTRIDNPLLTEEDGPVYQLRRWYEQFYVDVTDVKDEMTRRFEFEIDTRRANEAWHAEVEGNLARRAPAPETGA
ncbi:dioxygenase Rieske iron-sulfur component [Streptomyces venezuelae]|uniref:Rieske 2Fe-2S domain-containing protein n=1 Tax=Streptomyces gardneri TaxID=66892 RepID=UPI0006BE1557|nr:Rieske 2Fe-2S domain-containing protein [Streptomyces gardneri]ALO13260.1 dioxygenase Rieske iron-sulfur component [Streptomyces venezuelae]QPK49918.1 3-ketosteroid-9-alpha-hydroxylase subunit A [Streptomyces gardneri]WRK41486.1 Rieske 2Fe-2S domain-containing protein [Streptomyces venezuelae]CUM36049.1 Rieske (2Fe-2S) domain-containing protein [Streptomyces venezuelae]